MDSYGLVQALGPWLQGDHQAQVNRLLSELQELKRDFAIVMGELNAAYEDVNRLQGLNDFQIVEIATLQRALQSALRDLKNLREGSRNNPIDLTHE